MELEKNTLTHLINYLKEHGYPEDTFAIEYQINNHRVDLAIIDNKLNIPIMFFEIKSVKNIQSIEMGKKQLNRITNGFQTVPMYLVFPKDSHPFFEIEKIDFKNNDSDLENNYQLLNYSYQRNSRKVELLESKLSKRKSTFNWFLFICIILAILSITIGSINQFTSYKFDRISLLIFLFAAGFIILPFASKLKLLGIEFERIKEEK